MNRNLPFVGRARFLLGGLLLVGIVLAGCGKRRVLKVDEPDEPVQASTGYRPAPPIAVAPPPVLMPPAPRPTHTPERWVDRRKVRDALGELATARTVAVSQNDSEARRVLAERRERDRQRSREKEALEIRKQEISIAVSDAARKDLLQQAEKLRLTIVDEHPLVVRFKEDLRSGSVAYRMELNDTGLLGARAANKTWKGRLLWERSEETGEITISRPESDEDGRNESEPTADSAKKVAEPLVQKA